MQVTFLEAYAPLVKTISPVGKEPYPMAKNFTSHTETITTTPELFKAILAHSKKGHCLLKGNITRPLVKEPRKGATKTDEQTEWVCLDFDQHEAVDIDDELIKLGLHDISYVLQYSASHGLPENEGTINAHVFMLLENAKHAPVLKAWLMEKNMGVLREDLYLNACKNTLHWPMDISTCQNDKLLYIGTPIFRDMPDPMGSQLRISFVKRKLDRIPDNRVGEKPITALKAEERTILNKLRKAEGLPARNARTTWVGDIEVQNKPDVCTVTGLREGEDFVRLNLNGGDSWAYWHPVDNFELIHDYKSDTWYKTKELIPSYYAEKVADRQDMNATPTEEGDLILAFRDLASSDYYNGLWNPVEQKITLHKARNETQLDHWMRSHGKFLGEFIPVWEMKYLPKENFTVDEENHIINTFQRTKYMRLTPKTNDKFPKIKEILCHMLGVTPDNDPDKLYDHWINWFACIFQRIDRPRTSWVTHGTQGTGKGFVFNKIIKVLLGSSNTCSMLASNVEDDFNGWMEGILFAFIDEVDVDDFKEKGRVGAKLKNHITEPTIPIRHMRRTAYDAPNTCVFMFSSNMAQPVHIPEGDRRYNVGEYQGSKLPTPDDSTINNELEAFAQFLLAHKASLNYANEIIHTEARAKIQRLGITSIVETCRMISEGDFESLWLARADERLLAQAPVINEHVSTAQAYTLLLKDIAKNDFDGKLTRDEVQIILDYNVGKMPRSPNKFTSLLRHNNIETKRIRKNGVTTYGIETTWKASDELREEMAALTSKHRHLKVVKDADSQPKRDGGNTDSDRTGTKQPVERTKPVVKKATGSRAAPKGNRKAG